MKMMRTTLNLPDDVYRVARSLADGKGILLGEALAELVRSALKRPIRVNTRKPFPCFMLPPNAQPITLEQTLAAEDGV